MINNFKFQASIKLFYLVNCFFSLHFAAAQPGAIDLSFNSSDDGTTQDGPNSRVNTFITQADGKIIIGGAFTSIKGITRNRVARLNTDGSLDTGFDPGLGTNQEVTSTAIQSDGKILIGGAFTSYDGTTINRIARLNTDGSLDATFNIGMGADNTVRTVTLQVDGKIIIGGDFTQYNGTLRNRIARLNANGTLDTSFDPGTGSPSTVYSSALQSDGKIIIAGIFTSFNNNLCNRIARLNADGSLDTDFNTGSGVNAGVYANIALQTDGKIIIGGSFSTYNGSSCKSIARLNVDGTLDTSFDPNSAIESVSPGTTSAFIWSIALQNDGKIIIGGQFRNSNNEIINNIARLNADGILDVSFNSGGAGTEVSSTISCIKLQFDGKIIIAGNFTTFNLTARNHIAILNTDGTLHIGFLSGFATGLNGSVAAAILQPDGKIIIGGDFTTFNGTPRRRIARLNSDGSIDESFDPGIGANSGLYQSGGINALALQADGKILIGGTFTTYNNTPRSHIARLNADGSLDATFNVGSGLASSLNTTRGCYAIAVQTNGKILIGGQFKTYNGWGVEHLARLNADGSIDLSFPRDSNNTFYGGSFVVPIRTISLLEDGKIIIGGQFTNYFGTNRYRIARLNSDGTLDTSFDPGIGANNIVQASVTQPDGKIIIGGTFTAYNNTPANRIARLNSDGTLDTSFNSGTGIDGALRSFTIQPDGKIIIGGSFSEYNSISINRIACLNADGTLDTDFNPAGSGADNTVNTLALQPDGKIIVGGVFTSYNGTARNRITRIFGDNSPCGSGFVMVNDTSICGPAEITLHASGDGEISWFDNEGNLLGTGNSFNAGLIDSTKTFQVSAEAGEGCESVLKPLTVTVNPGLTPEFELTLTSDGYICAGSTVDISAPVGYASYLWSTGATSTSITVNQAGMYSLTVVDANGCTGGDDEIEIIADANPIASFTYNQESGYTVEFNNTSTNGSTYFWDFGGGNSSTQENPSFTYPFDGFYPITLIVSNPCGSDTLSTTIEVIKLSAGNIGLENSIQVFPNPFHELFQVNIDKSLMKKNINISIFNLMGQKVYNQQLTDQSSNTLLIEFNNKAQGVYIIQICNEGSCISKKLINN